MTVRIIRGDVRDVLESLPPASVHCVVTSPPYWGLRSYLPAGHPDKQREIGSEPTVEAWVETMVGVMRQIRRVLRADGTVFLNLGDSYAGSPCGGQSGSTTLRNAGHKVDQSAVARREQRAMTSSARRDNHEIPRTDVAVAGLKPKDLVGQPWRLAFALQQPYYAGKITSRMDREWLAAMIDAEGCFFIHKRGAGSSSHARYERADGTEAVYQRKTDTYGVGLEICNTSLAIIERVQGIVGGGTVTTQSPEQNSRRRQTIYRWRVAPNECRRIAQEVYPHLIAKQHQARLLLGCPSNGERAEAAHQALMGLHRGTLTDVDFPAPASLFEPGWYLRQEVIWAKRNPMPESTRDRFTKAHEHVFLLTPSARYYWDFEAVQQPASMNTHERAASTGENGHVKLPGNKAHSATAAYEAGDEKHRTKGGLVKYAERARDRAGAGARMGREPGWRDRTPSGWATGTERQHVELDGRFHDERKLAAAGSDMKTNGGFDAAPAVMPATRNPRDVFFGLEDEFQQFLRWKAEQPIAADVISLTSQPFRGAHFATFPPSLIEPFVLAGCPEGGTVLDPFGGSGTTGLVADRHHRDAVLIDIDERNVPMAEARISAEAGLFSDIGVTP